MENRKRSLPSSEETPSQKRAATDFLQDTTSCRVCGKAFTYSSNLLRHQRTVHGGKRYPCETCGKTFSRRDDQIRHSKVHYSFIDVANAPTSTPSPNHQGESTSSKSSSGENFQSTSQGTYHNPSTTNSQYGGTSPVLVDTDTTQNIAGPPPGFASALNGSCERWRTEGCSENVDLTSYLGALNHQQVLEQALQKMKAVKFFISVNVRFVRHESYRGEGDRLALPYFTSHAVRLTESSVINVLLDQAYNEIIEKMQTFIREGSGWVFIGIEFCDLLIVKYRPLKGGSYIPLPSKLAGTKSIINIKNEGDQCFLYSLLAHKFPASHNPHRPEHYLKHLNYFNIKGFDFPMPLNQISKFEELNSISINVFGYDEKDGVFPRHISEYNFNDCANLLLISKESTNHYCYIKDLDKLLFSQAKHKCKAHYCVYCLHRFSSAELLQKHGEACRKNEPQKIKMPEGEQVYLKFKNFEKKLPIPYYIVADFESYLEPLDEPAGEKTAKTAEHKPASFCFVVINHEGNLLEPPTLYRGADAVSVFLSELKRVADELALLMQVNQPLVMSLEDEEKFKSANQCHICEEALGDSVIVRDHCHLSGKFRGAAHQSCNINFKFRNFIPVVLHNLKNYDSHLIMQAIGEYKDSKIDCIANNLEKYITFNLDNLVFIDSLQFCNESLDKLAQNLRAAGEENFKLTSQVFDVSHLKYVLAKGFFPYDYFSDLHRLDETSLPPREAFFNKLTNTHISEEEYLHCQNIWSAFNMQTFGDYHDLYLKTDVLLLADVFQNFRNVCISCYGLDPLHYFTAPGLTFDAALKKTAVTLELLTDPDMYLFCEETIRGGVSTISNRFAEANNPHLPNYDSDKENSYILYLDCNNLYGHSLSQPLPVRGFRWVNEPEQIDVTKIDDNSPIGYLLEVDLQYPKELHTSHSDYPLAPESMSITEDMLSLYCKNLLELNGAKQNSKIKKLVPNLKDKIKYKLHYRNLKFYLEHGMVLTKIHRAIEFQQEAWLKQYIEFNSNMRAKATNNFEKNFFKLLNNSLYGKTVECLRKRRNVKLAQTENYLLKWTASPAFQMCRIFNEDLVGVEMSKPSLYLNRPIYTGVSVLDLSKVQMYSFYYDVLKVKYGHQMKLLFTDTDSLCLQIFTNDIYKDMHDIIEELDTSDYPPSHPLFSNANKKVIGKFKDETNSIPISSFIGLKAKMYSILPSEGYEKNTAKGISKTVKLRHEDYKQVLFNRSTFEVSQNQIRSERHNLFSLTVTKQGLSAFDDKRYILEDGCNTLAYGHHQIHDIS